MSQALRYIAMHPGCPILPVAEHVGPHGSRNFGYRTVHRLVKAGLVAYVRTSGRYCLTVAS